MFSWDCEEIWRRKPMRQASEAPALRRASALRRRAVARTAAMNAARGGDNGGAVAEAAQHHRDGISIAQSNFPLQCLYNCVSRLFTRALS